MNNMMRLLAALVALMMCMTAGLAEESTTAEPTATPEPLPSLHVDRAHDGSVLHRHVGRQHL